MFELTLIDASEDVFHSLVDSINTISFEMVLIFIEQCANYLKSVSNYRALIIRNINFKPLKCFNICK